MVDRRNMSVEDLIRSQLQSEEKFTDRRSPHFKLCIAVNFKSLQKQICQSFDLPFGIVVTKLKLVHVVERKMYYARQTFQLNCHCEFDEKFDILFNEDTIAQRFSSYVQFDCKVYALLDTFYRTEIELLVFKLYSVLLG